MSRSLRKEGISTDFVRDVEHVKRELFFSLARELNMNFAIRGMQVQVDIAQLFELSRTQNVPWKEYDLWIKAQMKEIAAKKQ